MNDITTPLKGSQGVLVDNIFIPVQKVNPGSNRSILIPIPAGSSYQSYLAILSESMPSDGNLGGKVFIIAFDTGEFDFGANKLFGNESDPDSPIASQKYCNGTIIFKGNGCAHTSLNFTGQYPIILDNYTEPSRPGVTLGFIDIRLVQTTTGYSVLIFNRTGGPTLLCRTLLKFALGSTSPNDHYAMALNPRMWLDRTDLQEAAEGLFASSLSIILFSTDSIWLPEYSANYTEYVNKWLNSGSNRLFVTNGGKAARVRFKGGTVPSGNYVTVRQPPFQFSVLSSISSMSGLYLDADTPESIEDRMLFRAELKQASDTADTGQPMEVVTSIYPSGQASAPVYEWYDGTVALNTDTALCLGIPLESLTEMPETWTFTTWAVVNSLTLPSRNNLPLFGIFFRETETGQPDFYIAAEQDGGGGLRFSCRDSAAAFRDSVDSASLRQASDFPLIDTGWHHVSLRYYKDTVELYIDGKPAASVAAALDMTLTSDLGCYTLQIGYINESSGQISYSKPQYFSDARFYTRALSVYEINTLAKNRRMDPEPEPDLDAGLVFHLGLKEKTETAETGQALTYNGENTYEYAGDVIACKFAGSSTGISCSASGFPSGSAQRTISVWLYMTGTGDYSYFFGYSGGSNSNNFGLCINGGGQTLGMKFGSDWSTGTNLTMNEWHHYLVTFNGTAITAYLDGGKIAETTASINTGTSLMSLAYNAGQGSTANPYTGYMREARIYSRVLRSGEITMLADKAQLS